jgi:hypothetical protein
MRKESVQKFDLEAAFKALDTVEIPTVKGIRPNREDLQEKFTRKLVTDILVEDYYDVGDTAELEQAQEEREAEVAKAKLARIEKIVDLDAESEDDILPSYVGKFIMQCPQCMTLFYKNEEDIERSEEAPDVVNINEPCQHCGNDSGYTLVGKVDTVGEEEAAQYDIDDFDENELNLDFDEEEASAEEPAEAEEEVATEGETEEEADLDLDLTPAEDDEEEVQESLALREDWDADVANADKLLDEIIKESGNDKYDDGDGYWSGDDEWCNRYMYYANSVANRAQVEELCEKHSTDKCIFYVLEDDAEEDPVSEIGYTLTKDAGEALTEATIHISKAEMAKLDKEVEEARKEVAKYNIPVKAQRNSAGETESVPDFEAVPEAQREAAKKAHDRYQKALAARPDRAKNIIKYTDVEESLTEEIDAATKDKLTKEIEEIDEKIAYYENQMKLAKDETDRQDFNRKIDGFYKLRNQKLQLIKDGNLKMADLELEAEETPTAESLTEDIDKDLDAKLKAHNDYIDYLKKMIEQEEDALSRADNEYVKKAIQRRLDAFKADLEEALPDTIKNEVAVEDLPTPEEADMEAAAENKDESKEKKESLTEATATVSRLKRNYSATEIMVKELKSIEPFNRLSTRTIQRVLLPYYIENMGREDLSTQALVEFFEYEGFAPYVLDHFMTMDSLARKELLKADEKFMQIFNDYAAAYSFFPGKDETLEPGESEFDYAFNIMFDIDADGLAHDTELTRNTIKSLGKMYAEGYFDKSLIVEELTEDAAVDVLFDSEEFKTPISDAEIDKIRAQYEGLEEDIAPGVETEIAINNIVDTWESVEDFDDETFNKLTEGYLTEVYSNVKSFETTNCDLRDNKLIVEGTITFNSGKTKSTAFIYETKETADKTIVLEGLNADFASEKAFTLNCKVDTENRLIVESLTYKYTINNTLVEGLLK